MIDHVIARFRLRARLRLGWLESLWDLHEPAAIALEGLDTPAAEADWHARAPGSQPLLASLRAVEAELAAESRLTLLAALFALAPQESDLLEACFAVAVEPSLAAVCGELHDDPNRRWLTEALVARLYGHERRPLLVPDSALRRWELVTTEALGPALPAAVICDPLVRDWLCGHNRIDEALVGAAHPVKRLRPLHGWPVDATVARIRQVLEGGERVRVFIAGARGSGRRTFAGAVAAALELPLLAVDSDRIDDASWAGGFARAHRQAFFDRCALAWTGDAVTRRAWPEVPVAFPVQFVITEAAAARPGAAAVDLVVDLAPPALTERQQLWRALVPAAATWPADQVAELATRYRVTVGDLAQVGRRGAATPAAAATMVREATRGYLGELATWLDCPFTADDLVLPAPLRRSLDEFTFEARDRVAFWEQPTARRLFPQGRGLIALFTGKPGTGKTMAAQVLARTLGVDLFRISLSAVVSKYVGETSQNLERILTRAEHMDAVLLFDEADALFSRRTEVKDAQDRFANSDTNHLLIAIEAYRGIAILASNKRPNIDAAFVRRLRYVLDFPRPDPAQRLEIWRRLCRELAGVDRAAALDAVLGDLANVVELGGAEIKYALLAALFAARQDGAPLDRHHLIRGIDRELTKDGRGLSERDKLALMRPLRVQDGAL